MTRRACGHPRHPERRRLAASPPCRNTRRPRFTQLRRRHVTALVSRTPVGYLRTWRRSRSKQLPHLSGPIGRRLRYLALRSAFSTPERLLLLPRSDLYAISSDHVRGLPWSPLLDLPRAHFLMLPTIATPVPTAPVTLVLPPMDDAFTVKQEHRPVSVLVKRFGVDFAAAMTASFGVSPFITIVDRAIAENASGRRTLAIAAKELSMDLVRHPLAFCRTKEFMWIFGLYSATYATANSIESFFEWKEQDGALPKLAGTTLVNMTTVIAKDRAFARMFGVVKPHPFPLASIGLFAVRDSLTVVSCFHAPEIITEKLSAYGVSEGTTAIIAQIGAPIAVQILSTPLHLLGLDFYNHPKADHAARIQFIQREYYRSALARIARIGPAFGIGGIGNKAIRTRLREMTE